MRLYCSALSANEREAQEGHLSPLETLRVGFLENAVSSSIAKMSKLMPAGTREEKVLS